MIKICFTHWIYLQHKEMCWSLKKNKGCIKVVVTSCNLLAFATNFELSIARVAKWFTALCCVWHAQSWVWTPHNTCGHMICKYVDWKGLAANFMSNLLLEMGYFLKLSNADLYTVSRCCTRSESEHHYSMYMWESMQVRDPRWLWNPDQMSPEV